MVLEAVKNPSVTLQQGSAIGRDVKVPEPKAPDTAPDTANTSVSLSSEGMQKVETQQRNAQENTSGGSQNSLDRKNSEELPKGNEAMRKAVEQINKNAKNNEVIFGIHDATNRVTIKIIDKDSKKVLKEFPPEKTLDMIAKVWEMAGLMVDEKM